MKKVPKANMGYKSGGSVKKARNGGAVNYKGAAGAAGFTGSGTYAPTGKNVGKEISKLKNGGQLPLLHTKPATKNTGDAMNKKAKGGASMGKCKGGC